ncbi:hypothetical protein Tco_0791678 [Tanacetum coccineum]
MSGTCSGTIAHLSEFKDFDGVMLLFGEVQIGGKNHCCLIKAKATSEDINVMGIGGLVSSEYSVSKDTSANGSTERKNRILSEAARTMLAGTLSLPKSFWAEAVFYCCYVYKKFLSPTHPLNKIKIVLSCQFGRMLHTFDDASLKSVADAQIQDQDGTHDDCSLQDNDLDGTIPTTEDTQSSVSNNEVGLNSYSELGFIGAIYKEETTRTTYMSVACLLISRITRRVSNALSDHALGRSNARGTSFTVQTKIGIEIEALRISMAYASYMGFTYTKDVKIYKVVEAYMDYIKHPELDDIIFGSTKKELCDEFEKLMKDNFSMSSLGRTSPSFGLSCLHSTIWKSPWYKDADADDVDELLYEIFALDPLMYLH